MLKIPPARYLVRDVLMTLYAFRIALAWFCGLTRGELSERGQTLFWITTYLGIFGTSLWCICYYPSERGTVMDVLLILGCLTLSLLFIPQW